MPLHFPPEAPPPPPPPPFLLLALSLRQRYVPLMSSRASLCALQKDRGGVGGRRERPRAHQDAANLLQIGRCPPGPACAPKRERGGKRPEPTKARSGLEHVRPPERGGWGGGEKARHDGCGGEEKKAYTLEGAQSSSEGGGGDERASSSGVKPEPSPPRPSCSMLRSSSRGEQRRKKPTRPKHPRGAEETSERASSGVKPAPPPSSAPHALHVELQLQEAEHQLPRRGHLQGRGRGGERGGEGVGIRVHGLNNDTLPHTHQLSPPRGPAHLGGFFLLLGSFLPLLLDGELLHVVLGRAHVLQGREESRRGGEMDFNTIFLPERLRASTSCRSLAGMMFTGRGTRGLRATPAVLTSTVASSLVLLSSKAAPTAGASMKRLAIPPPPSPTKLFQNQAWAGKRGGVMKPLSLRAVRTASIPQPAQSTTRRYLDNGGRIEEVDGAWKGVGNGAHVHMWTGPFSRRRGLRRDSRGQLVSL